jgi:hypothetical protein
MAYCDHGYGCPSAGPRVSDPVTYCSSTPRVQLPVVARWHTHPRCLATPIHEICGLNVAAALWQQPRGFAVDSIGGICYVLVDFRKI